MSLDTKDVTQGVVSTISDDALVMVAGSGGWSPISFADLAKAVRGTLQIGGRNYLLKSNVPTQGNSYPCGAYYFGDEKPIEGEVYTVTIWGDFSDAREMLSAWNSYGSVKCFDIYKVADGLYRGTGKWKISGALNIRLAIFQGKNIQGSNGTVSISKIKMEKGNVASDWSAAPEDLSDSWGGVNQRFTTTYKSEDLTEILVGDCLLTVSRKGGAHEPAYEGLDGCAEECADGCVAFESLDTLYQFIGNAAKDEPSDSFADDTDLYRCRLGNPRVDADSREYSQSSQRRSGRVYLDPSIRLSRKDSVLHSVEWRNIAVYAKTHLRVRQRPMDGLVGVREGGGLVDRKEVAYAD